jgi:hypothetical protein
MANFAYVPRMGQALTTILTHWRESVDSCDNPAS